MKSIQQISVILLTFMSALNAYALQVTGEKAIESVIAFRGIVGASAAFSLRNAIPHPGFAHSQPPQWRATA